MNKHPFDPLSFLFGLLFLVLGLVFVMSDVSVLDLGWRWFWPASVIFLGMLFLSIAAKRAQRRAPQDPNEEPSEPL